MEILKTILKSALQAKSSTLSLRDGSVPTNENNEPVGKDQITEDNITELSEKFFVNKTDGIHKSKLNIKSIGNIYILGDLDKKELHFFFPPDEETKCKDFFAKMASENSRIKQEPGTEHKEIKELKENSIAENKAPKEEPAAQDSGDTFEVGDNLPVDFFDVNAKNIFGSDEGGPASPEPAPAEEAKPASTAKREFPDPKPEVAAIQSAPPALPVAPIINDKDIQLVYAAELPGESTTSSGRNPIDKLLKLLMDKGGSDLHLTSGVPVCMRIDGEIVRVNDKPISFDYMKELLEPIIPSRNRKEFSEVNDTDFAYEINNVGRFRVNLFRDRNGIGTVLRVIPSKILTATDLDLPPAILKFGKLSKGLVVVTGPTGSGKSTTLAAIVDWINKNRTEHILTIEDPIEFVHQQNKCLINHREIGRHTTSFTRALRAALREDPDIVLIGEMRDLETVAIGIETAETGHLVFGTLHTNTAVSTVDRIIDQFPEGQQAQIRMMLSESLKGVVAQTLLKKKGGGRIAAHEILVVNDAVGAMIREGKSHMIENHMQTQKKDGNLLLNDCLLSLVERGLVDADHAILKAIDKDSLMSAFTDKNIPFERNIKIAS